VRNKSAFDVVARHVIETLPAAIEQRVELLDRLIEFMPLGHPQEKEMRLLVARLYQHRILQRELPLKFGKGKQ